MTTKIKVIACNDWAFKHALIKYDHLIVPVKTLTAVQRRERFITYEKGDWLVFKQEPEYPRYLGRFNNLMSAVFHAAK
jgi:hypothetical protein